MQWPRHSRRRAPSDDQMPSRLRTLHLCARRPQSRVRTSYLIADAVPDACEAVLGTAGPSELLCADAFNRRFACSCSRGPDLANVRMSGFVGVSVRTSERALSSLKTNARVFG